jgi:cyanate permease
MSVAFISGSLDALLYDTLKEKGYKKDYGDIQNISHNLKLVGMIAASFAGNYLIRHFEVQELFRTYSITFLIAFFLLIFFIKEPKIKDEKEYIPKYSEIFKKALDNLKSNLSLRRLVVYMTMISSVAYFFIWFYQVLLLNIGVSKEYFGDYRVTLLIAEVILSMLIIRVLNLVDEKKRRIIIVFVTILVSLGFFSGVFIKNQVGIILFVVLAGGIGLKFRNIFAQFVNSNIDSTERATTLSAVSMFRRIALVVLNPVVGYFSDINLDYTLLSLGLVGIVSIFLFLPKREDFSLNGK